MLLKIAAFPTLATLTPDKARKIGIVSSAETENP